VFCVRSTATTRALTMASLGSDTLFALRRCAVPVLEL
jgi:hypothetical protein